ncbi:MAG TPA: MMPL family transporter [Acidimicrobiales bacterium]|nr:MMPL family transporter [Acidimicrobiales bacterium]
MLVRLADWCYRRRRLTVLLWFVAAVVIIGVSSSAAGEFRADFTEGDSESTKAFDLLEEEFTIFANASIDIVYEADDPVTDPSVVERVEALRAELLDVGIVESVEPKPEPSPDEHIGAMDASLSSELDDLADVRPDVERIVEIVEDANADGFQVEAGGEVLQFVEPQEFGESWIGFLMAIVILLVAFGSVVAAGLPIFIALFGIAISFSVMMLLANVLDVPDFAPQMAEMMGVGVGIDYALFVIARYKQGLRDGLEPRDAVVLSIDTAGRAVLFAGATVVIAILGMIVMGLGFLYGLAASTSFAVLIVMAATITLLPALLGFVGRNIDKLHIPFVKKDTERGADANLAHKWSRVVQRYPWPAAILAFLVLAALTLPMFDLRFGFPDASNNPETATTRRAYDLLAEAYGPGANGPLLVAADTKSDAGLALLGRVSEIAAETEGVAGVTPPFPSPTGDAAIVRVTPETGPQEAETEALVKRLRNDVVPAALDGGDGSVNLYVGGSTAAMVDQNDYLTARLPFFIGAVVLLSFLLLMAVFRSILVPLKAAIMNLLSIGAAYGIVSLSVNGGWVGDLIGIEEATPVPGFIPMMMFAILFGLSMDYEVFLLSRVREEYVRTGNNATAVAEGLASTARVITAAAAIMVSVFGAFLLGDIIFVKMVGLGLATAIFVDATIVRMVLVPATMELLGDRNWWYPAWLDRITPHISVEGTMHDDLDAELARLTTEESTTSR